MLGSAVQAGLEQSGYTVDWLRNGGEAASALRDDEPDLMVLDLGLPEKDGLTVLRELRTRDSSLPVLIPSRKLNLSGRALRATRQNLISTPNCMTGCK